MREIKFRAYHKIRKEMYSVHGWHSEYVFKDTLDGIGCEGNPDKLDDVELMQFTGLKDKNGVDIYEGDICEANRIMYDNSEKTKHTVVFERGQFIYGSVPLYIVQESVPQFELYIVGNIHENKHLIS